ncbi:MAG: twin-arginine translocase subunit TatC [Prolixibacteraceae bacterium]|nr:twin-arginine translocase subunit TatC [Prolixibacteraceae bacterium]
MFKSRKKKSDAEKEMPFLSHLEELRWHLVRALLVSMVFMVLAFINRDIIFNDIILKPKTPGFFTNYYLLKISQWLSGFFNTNAEALAINQYPLDLVNIDMAGQFMAHIKISIVAGLIVASPYIVWEMWRFIKPALHSNEKQTATGAVFYITTLFITGVLFGYYLISPLSIHFLSTYIVSQEVTNTIKLSSYIGTVTSVTFASGIIFELPVVVLFLSRIGLVTPGFMRKYRKHAYVILLILSAIITPPDVFSQLLVCGPLVLLYEISVFISRSVERKLKREANENTKDVAKRRKKR